MAMRWGAAMAGATMGAAMASETFAADIVIEIMARVAAMDVSLFMKLPPGADCGYSIILSPL